MLYADAWRVVLVCRPPERVLVAVGAAVQWWIWVIVVVVVIVLVAGAMLAVQARRRRGGVIVDPDKPAGPGAGGGR